MIKKHLLLSIIILLSACQTSKDYIRSSIKEGIDSSPSSPIIHSAYFIGDAGEPPSKSSETLNLLKQFLDQESEHSSVVFLGDNIYPEGLHSKKNDHRPIDVENLNAQLDILKTYKGHIAIIPGNHDWNRGSDKGWKFIKRQEKYVEKYLGRGNTFLPDGGCPGPKVVNLESNLVLIIVDTQWWLHPHKKAKGQKDGCNIQTREEMLTQLKDVLKKYRHKNILVAGHHPLFSNGTHGGKFKLSDHLFPLKNINSNLLIPIPIIGSIYPMYRKLLGHKQDLSHPVYQEMINAFTKAFEEYDNIVYLAGHEHNLQYRKEKNNHYIISGSGSKVSYLKKNQKLQFGAERKGFSKIDYHKNGEVWLSFYSPELESTDKLLYRKKIFQSKTTNSILPEAIPTVSYKGQKKLTIPNPNYEAGKTKRFFFGELNRELWTLPIEVPYLDIHFEKGGLVPIKKGGGMQTKSLRLKGKDGHEYVLRTIKKDASLLLGRELKNTLARDIVQDGLAGSHPYAALCVPPLAKAVSVYFTRPKLVLVPDDPILGDYRSEFGGSLCLFEERPAGDMRHASNFGSSKKVINYSKVIDKVQSDDAHQLDKFSILRARLLDMLMSDWDRHDDQWRWASFKEGKRTIYRPIPRDRDQVFFKFDGLIPSISNRKWLLRKFQPFDPDIRDIEGQNFNARYFDRAFLNEVTLAEWIAVADSMKLELTNKVIQTAIKQLPVEAYKLQGLKLEQILKQRRDKLTEFANRYYKVLAKTVDITGTLENDYFEINRLDSNQVSVDIFKRKKGKKKGKKQIYHRVFNGDETKEICIYGLDGNDEYKIKGDVDKTILVRIIGGTSKDKIVDSSNSKELGKKTYIYDSNKGENKIIKSKETKVFIRNTVDAYDYDRESFAYDVMLPLPSVGYNVDDGLFLGGGFQWKIRGFKKSPFKTLHHLTANVSATNAFNLDYKFQFTELFGNWDLAGNATMRQPLIFDFHPPGNESETLPGEENQIRLKWNSFQPFIQSTSQDQMQKLQFGIDALQVSFDDGSKRPIGTELKNGEDGIYSGLFVRYILENKDQKLNPERGIGISLEASTHKNLSKDDLLYHKLSGNLSLYFPLPKIPIPTSLAIRGGYHILFGDYPFHQANYLDGNTNFRGIPRNRFSGKKMFYQNTELRFNIIYIKNYILPFQLGLLTHYDLGRVWESDENSDLWHKSHGLGLYINALDFIILNGTMSYSDEGKYFSFGTKFLF